MNLLLCKTRPLNRLAVTLAAYPLAWIVFFYLFVVRARLHLGNWPAAYYPDPKELGFTFHHQAIWWGVIAMPVFGLGVLATAFTGRCRPASFRVWPLALLAGSLVLLAAWMPLDPGDFLEWFVD